MPGDYFTVLIVMLNCPSWNTASSKDAAEGNIEVFINEASALAVRVVLAEVVHEPFSLASLAVLLSAGFELSIRR